MIAAKLILRTIAFLVGALASWAAGVSAYREYYGGPPGIVPLFFIFVAIMAGIPLLITWRREFVQDPWWVPSAVFAVCVFFYGMSFAERMGLYEFGPGRDSPWLKVGFKVLVYMLFASLSYVTTAFIYHGTH